MAEIARETDAAENEFEQMLEVIERTGYAFSTRHGGVSAHQISEAQQTVSKVLHISTPNTTNRSGA